jgi:hypothetical protein
MRPAPPAAGAVAAGALGAAGPYGPTPLPGDELHAAIITAPAIAAGTASSIRGRRLSACKLESRFLVSVFMRVSWWYLVGVR